AAVGSGVERVWERLFGVWRMSEERHTASRIRNETEELAPIEEARYEVKEAIILVKDARLFSVADRALWHLDRLASPHPIQPRFSGSPSSSRPTSRQTWNGSPSSSFPLPPPSPPQAAAFDVGNDLVLVDVNVSAVSGKRPDPSTAAIFATSRGMKRHRNPA
ncbi:unnamed protein product, partial [Ascophyllum nodosum]